MNFASELSDLRHRHGFQVILVHGNHTSPALLQHAHRHVAFQEITADLPPRMLVKSQVGHANVLEFKILLWSTLYYIRQVGAGKCNKAQSHFSVDQDGRM